jgi:hypothetical protein
MAGREHLCNRAAGGRADQMGASDFQMIQQP